MQEAKIDGQRKFLAVDGRQPLVEFDTADDAIAFAKRIVEVRKRTGENYSRLAVVEVEGVLG